MNKLKSLLNSKIFLTVLSIVFTGVATVLIFPVSNFIAHRSLDVVTNFYMVAGFMFLLAMTAGVQTFLLVTLIWGKNFLTEKEKRKHEPSAEDLNEIDFSMRSMKVTGAKKSFIFIAILALNIFAFDYAGQGILVTGSKRYHVLTRLRSPDGQQRADAVPGAIQLVGDQEVESALRRILETPGEAREWAVYAAGVRRDKKLKNPIAALLRTGDERERAAAAVALARMEDPRLIRLVIDAWPKFGKLQSDALIALGMIGKKRIGNSQDILLFSDAELHEVGQFLVQLLESRKLDKVLTRLAIWCLNRFESPEGLPYLESLLSTQTDTQTLCVALEALGNIGAADSSPKMVAFIPKADKKAQCNELVAHDFTGKQVLLCNNSNLVARIIYEIAHIGDYRAVPEMSRVAENPAYQKSIRNLAKEFVFKMQYQPRN
ncbi:MAG: HEAT repeat domain-containing protein [Deltaproteobacteria bacterium]|nr:HEAT repeat domain-containing protein [Deltaproteobacteria bacterium]MBN2671484.1 HEAT repeat domain-containing protein [Deltaproteobacteria bacterium]